MQEPITLAPASKKQELFLNSDATITLCGGAAGSGKALRHGEKVLTVAGFINIEDVKVGDKVITPKNTIEEITAVYPQGIVDIYRVTFEDNSFVDACKDHLWAYSEDQTEAESKVGSTLQLREKIAQGFRPTVPLVEPLDLPERTLEIKPYTLGVLLGGSSTKTNDVAFVTSDEEIRANVEKDGYNVEHLNQNDVGAEAKTYGVLDVQESLSSLKLLGCESVSKFIPDEYKLGSVTDRFALVQGMMDTEGCVQEQGSSCYFTSSISLARDLVEVLHSLGFTATISTELATDRKDEILSSCTYSIHIRGKNQNRLFRLQRKAALTKDSTTRNRIVSIEAICQDYATCISISGPDKLFVTSNYIVTHNTYTLLLIALKFMQHPRATGVVFRRTSKMLTSPGSIWHEAVNMYTTVFKKGLRIRHRENEIIFPNGALLKFSHMQHSSNMYDHKGGQYSFVAFDEATDFTEEMIVYLLSRMRNADVDYNPQMFLLTNPDYNSFLRLWIQDFYLDPLSGIPKEETASVKRYFFRQGNAMLWYNSLEEAEAIHGKGYDSGITSFTFIPANCLDNPVLLKNQPTYRSRLMSLPRVEMERLLLGSWFARPESSGLFKREWVQLVHTPNSRARRRIRSWDFAFTKPSEQNPNPDWTRGVLISKDPHSVYTVEDIVSMRDRVHEVEKLIFDTAERDGHEVIVSIPQDPNAQAGAYARDLQRRLAEKGFTCRLTRPVKSKVTRFAPFASIAQAGYVNVVTADWNKEFFDELEVFDGSNKYKDDMADACSDATLLLNSEVNLPDFVLPTSHTMSNPFAGVNSNVSTTLETPVFNL